MVSAVQTYDDQNPFAKILRGELPATVIAENDYAISFNDIAPLAPVHVLVIPKLAVCNLHEFTTTATPEQAKGFFAVVDQTITALGLRNKPYNIFASTGEGAGQDVFHFHMHIISGRLMKDAIS